MPKITIIGGGSGKFVRELVVDFFSFKNLQDIDLCLMDINAERLDRSRRLVEKIIADRSLPARVTTTLDQREALTGADYVVITIMVGGFESYHSDVAIPAEYGIYQAVSDTVGPGAVMRILRTAPVLRQIAANLRDVAPNAWILNYANPMAMNCWTLFDAGHTRTVGLCHSIQGFLIWRIQDWLKIPFEQIRYEAAGINHVDFYLKLEHKGKDLYPVLRQEADRIVKAYPEERVRFELLEHLGHIPAEGPWHQLEYYPWFHKNQAKVDHYSVGAYWGYNTDLNHFNTRTAELEAQISGSQKIDYTRSHEYGSYIISALEGGTPFTFYGNVRNKGLIENLPGGSTVEVPCVADANGIYHSEMGRIPPQLAAVMTPHIAVHELAVTAVARKDRKMLRQAIAADPLAGAILTLDQIKEMTDKLLAANAAYLKGWQ